MEEDLISVIVPVYNTERYLAACLDSILSQSYRHLEVIVINDGSTDFSPQIAQSYSEKDDRIIVYNHSNEGLAEARNRGLEVSTGNYITFVDSDDLLLPNALEVLLDAMVSNDADIVQGLSIRGEVLTKPPVRINIKSNIYTPKEAITEILYQRDFVPSACGNLYKKSLFDKIKFEKGILYEDLDIFYKLLSYCQKIVKVDFPVYFYRNTEGSILNSWKPQRLDVLKVTEHLENYIRENYPDILPAAKDRRLSANFNMYALCSIHGDSENAAKCWEHIRKNRRQSLFNPKVRGKNKAGILLSYLGKHIFNLAARKIYK